VTQPQSVSALAQVPWWGLLSATAAPILLVGGWTVAAAHQRGRFDPVVETVSALSARGATDRWIMTAALTGLGVCHLVTAFALRPAAAAGRVALGAGGLATLMVAAFPLPADDSGSALHGLAAGTAFLALAVWPALAIRWPARVPRRLLTYSDETAADLVRPAVALPAATVLLGLVAWFGGELAADRGLVGLSERAAAGAQAIWPLAAVVLARREIAHHETASDIAGSRRRRRNR
jgi:Protein of unknown function (DUF998)